MSPYLLLFFAIGSEVIATTALKASEGFTRLVPSVIVVAGYGAAFYLLSLVLRQVPLNIAYAIWAGVGTAMTVLVGVVLYKEAVDVWRIAGILLIISGVVVLNFFGGAHAA
ncbi:MAG: multidrug efflux SMR transporter [bacterium]|nr:multidrug efflux SMR transporter [bacterium]